MSKKYLSEEIEALWNLPKPKLSFEFFPPKSEEMEQRLWETVKAVEPLHPEFVSVTYGAGGSTREKTHQTVVRILEETSLKPAAHLTCVGHTKAEIKEIATNYEENGIKHIVALRGDSPDGGKYVPHPQGYNFTIDMIEDLKKIYDFEISVAAFPETHPEAKSEKEDLKYLKAKFDAGATRAITQYFFDPEKYLQFLDKARKIGISGQIVPGILLVANYSQMIKFSIMCNATVPNWVRNLLDGTDDRPEVRGMIGTYITARICNRLRTEGVDQFHFYTLNRPSMAVGIARILGVK
jgi:methylenetetrahydrofolate reductase (NADPH)